MPIDIEKEVIAIKITLARLEEKLDRVNILADEHYDLERRVRDLEDYKNKLIGWSVAASASVALLIEILSKTIFK